MLSANPVRRDGYSLADQFPLFHVTAIMHRSNPIYLTTIVGKPPQEDYHMGRAV